MNKSRVKIGQHFEPVIKPVVIEKNVVSGNRWKVYRKVDSFYFEFDTGELVEKLKTIKIEEIDFNDIKEGKLDYTGLVKKYKL